jgi:long-chain acyl-CoA synthetase
MNLTGTTLTEARAAVDRLLKSTLPELLIERAKENPKNVALRYKRDGIFHELTWEMYVQQIRQVSAGLIDMGLMPGDRFAIMGDPCLEYFVADNAAMFAGAVPCGIYPTNSPEETGYILELTGIRHFLAEDQEHLDRLLEGEQELGKRLVDHIILSDPRTFFLYDDPRIILFENLKRRSEEKPSLLEEVDRRVDALTPEDPADITFTSGTTGLPKAAMHSHKAILVGLGYAFLELMPELRAKPHRVPTHLPLAHVVERSMALVVPVMSDVIPHIGEQNQSLLSLLNDVRPTFLHGVPRIFEKLQGYVNVAVDTSSGLAKYLFQKATNIGRRRVKKLWEGNGRRANLLTELAYWITRSTMTWPAIHKVGLTHCVGAVCGGAPLPPEIQEIWQAWGIPLRDFFGCTETCVIGAQKGRWPEPGSPVYSVYPLEIKVAEDGELWAKGPGLIIEYYADPEATKEVLDSEGFLATGDLVVGHGDDGFKIVDRKKDIIITSGGKNIAPATIENALKASPYISEVIVFGDQRKFISAMIEIDFETVSHWARENNVVYTGFRSLSENKQVIGLIEMEVNKYNERLARVEQVKKFRIIPKELEPEDGDTTPTRKVRRKQAYEMFGDLVEVMYSGAKG